MPENVSQQNCFIPLSQPRCYIQPIHRTAGEFLERETGIEPATNSLEGCDSTTELLPPENSYQGSGFRDQVSVLPEAT